MVCHLARVLVVVWRQAAFALGTFFCYLDFLFHKFYPKSPLSVGGLVAAYIVVIFLLASLPFLDSIPALRQDTRHYTRQPSQGKPPASQAATLVHPAQDTIRGDRHLADLGGGCGGEP